jgi:hypothetical protein
MTMPKNARKLLAQLSLAALCASSFSVQAQHLPPYDLDKLARTHSVTAPEWGPYSRRYSGISHIPDKQAGTRFDFTIAAGLYKAKVIVPNTTYLSGYHHWEASPDLQFYSIRQQLEWKDKIYVDIAFAPWSANSRVAKVTMVNNTDELQGLSLNLMAGLQFDDTSSTVQLPQKRTWISAVDYSNMQYAKPRADDSLRKDAYQKGEVRSSVFTGGSGLADGFGKDIGDKVAYRINADSELKNASILVRYRLPANSQARFKVTGVLDSTLELAGSGDFAQKLIPLGKLAAGSYPLELAALSAAPIEIDGLTLIEADEASAVQFNTFVKRPKPVTDEQSLKQGIVLKYADVAPHYGITWDADIESSVRYILTDDYDNAVKSSTDFMYEHRYAVRNDAYTSNVYLRSFNLAARTQKTIYILLSQGSKQQVVSDSQSFLKANQAAAIFDRYAPTKNDFSHINPEGKKYQFSQERMQATMLQNIAYPLYAEREVITQFIPGKRWNSLYTWDGGFIGLGMLDIDLQRGIEALNSYTNPPTASNAYIHHGSPVPVQFFIYQDIWNRTQSKELMGYFYDRLKNYYAFFTGQYGSSTTGKLNSNLLNTFDYFYNSGGWDDYPAQLAMHKGGLARTVSPAISSSLAIRIAKMMKDSATILGKTDDIATYDRDIAKFESALQKHSWDETAGYFSYVQHDPVSKQASGIFRAKDGSNFNQGVDGVYPLVAGITTPAQTKTLMSHLFSPKKLWTPYGITTVDQSASYYSVDGYWNGTVWFPHQFVLWKTMLDLGEGKRAMQIATTALDVYQRETASTYNTTELIRLLTGRGFGWHQFSGLSAPVLNWFSAYYRPGSINVGFDGWIINKTFNADHTALDAQIKFTAKDRSPGVLICMKSGKKYKVTVNGKPVKASESVPGTLFINIPKNVEGSVHIKVHTI